MNGIRKRKLNLFKINPHCSKCGERVFLSAPEIDKRRIATVEHVYPKGHEKRGTKEGKQILYCYECNQISNIYYRCTGELYYDAPPIDWGEAMRILAGYFPNSKRLTKISIKSIKKAPK